jgi:hypothetical protein
MSREDAIENLLERLAVAKGDAAKLGLSLAAYLLEVAMLEVLERETGPGDRQSEQEVRRIDRHCQRDDAAQVCT